MEADSINGRKGKKHKLIFPVIFFIIAVFLCMSAPEADTAYAEENIKVKALDSSGKARFKYKDINITAALGYNGQSKYGKNIRTDVIIDNQGGDFAGKFRVEYTRSDAEGTAMVEKSFAAASGESKRVQFALPANFAGADVKIKLALCDESGRILSRQYITRGNKDSNSLLFAGTLSDSQDTLKYISNSLAADKSSFSSTEQGIVYEFKDGDITDDEKMLDTLDVIVIDNFDTGKLSKGQIKAITSWISNGGMLVLGSGADTDKVLKAFSGKLLNGTAGDIKSIRTNFGISRKELISLTGENLVNKRVPLDITQLRIKGATPVLTDRNEHLMSKIPYGKGNVLVAEFSLAFEDETARLYGGVIVDTIKNNLSKDKKRDMGITGTSYAWRSYNSMYSYWPDTMRLNETDSLPNIKLYGIILIVYILFAGPVSYIIAKKRDKRNLLWFVVPILSIVFSVTIYLIGTSTRIQKPYINYVSTIELPESGNAQNKLKTTFSITNSSNKAYKVPLPVNTSVIPSSVDEGYYDMSINQMDKQEFDYGVDYGADNTNLVMNRLSAFESVSFDMDSQSVSKGTVSTDIIRKDGKLSGIISNKMSYGLENCFLFSKGKLYNIGNLPAGKSFDISRVAKKDIYEEDQSYGMDALISDAVGGSIYDGSSDSVVRRRFGMLAKFITSYATTNTWFYGFAEDGAETGFTKSLPYDQYGETGVYKNIELTEQSGGYDVIGSLENYVYECDNDYTDGYYVYADASAFEVKYKFPEKFVLKKITYNKETSSGEYNLASYGYAENAFLGTAMVKDKRTGKYIKLFSSAKEAEITNINKYLDSDGCLTIYYDFRKNTRGSDIDSCTLPGVELAGVYRKEAVKQNGKNR